MTLTIQLSPQEEAWLRAKAEQSGVEPDEYARRVLTAQLPPRGTAAEATRRLLEAWQQEDAQLSVEEADAELADFKHAMNAPREAAGQRRLYP